MFEKIYVSPSSQTENAYAVGDTTEAVQCRKIAVALVAALQRCGFEAMTNLTGSMYARVTESDKYGAALHLPIHTNAHNKKVQGTRLFCYNTTGEGYKACKAIMAALAPITPGNSDSITAKKSLYEIWKPKAATAYIEVAFHDNPEEAQWIIDSTEAIAEAICQGVCEHYGHPYVEDVVEPEQSDVLYKVQVGAFSKKSNAEAMQKKLKTAGYNAIIVKVEK